MASPTASSSWGWSLALPAALCPSCCALRKQGRPHADDAFVSLSGHKDRWLCFSMDSALTTLGRKELL